MSAELSQAAAMLMAGDDEPDAEPINYPFTHAIWPLSTILSTVAASLVWNDLAKDDYPWFEERQTTVSGSDDPIYYKPYDIYWKPVILTGYASLAFLPMWFVEEYYAWGAIGSLIWKGLSAYMGYRADDWDSLSDIDNTWKTNMILHGVGGGIDLIVASHAFMYDWCNNGLPSKCKKEKEVEIEEDPMSEDDYYYYYRQYDY